MSFLSEMEHNEFNSYGLIEEEIVLKERWIAALEQVLETAQITIPQTTGVESKNGRNGEHSVELEEALEILGEVYHRILLLLGKLKREEV